MAETTDCSEPSAGVIEVEAPSAPTIENDPPVRLKVEVSVSDDVELVLISDWAVASWLTVKVTEPVRALAVAEAATELSLEVAVRAPQVLGFVRFCAAVSSDWNLVLRSW